VVGPTGSGKTNMVHVILAGFARATDVLTWVIDLNAGSAGLPWVLPALTGQLTAPDGAPVRPGIDWLAATHEEALAMLEAVLRIARHRKTVYQDLMARANTDLLPVSPQIPQIMLVVDEGAEILTSTDRTLRQLAGKILEVIRIARAMGIRTVLTALGATGSVLGNLMIRREAKVRVALTGGETEGMDLNRMFPGSRGLRVDQAPYKGSGFLGTPEAGVGVFKAWRILPDQIRDITAATAHLHPILDAPSAAAAGEAYARRWEVDRTAWLHHTIDTGPDAGTGAAGPHPAARPGLNLSALRTTQPEQEPDTDADALAARLMAEIDQHFGTTDEPGTPPPPEREEPSAPRRPGLNLSALRGQNEPPQQGPDAGPPWLAQAIDAIESAGAMGLKPSAVAELVGKDRKTVRAALRAAVERGELVYRDNGPHSVYVHPDHA
ncbi:MAG TPA: hypothetical protein VK545_14870, partial [Streptomyces sp.]|nr:hypothetical protein [Streptomyces sp.]